MCLCHFSLFFSLHFIDNGVKCKYFIDLSSESKTLLRLFFHSFLSYYVIFFDENGIMYEISRNYWWKYEMKWCNCQKENFSHKNNFHLNNSRNLSKIHMFNVYFCNYNSNRCNVYIVIDVNVIVVHKHFFFRFTTYTFKAIEINRTKKQKNSSNLINWTNKEVFNFHIKAVVFQAMYKWCRIQSWVILKFYASKWLIFSHLVHCL